MRLVASLSLLVLAACGPNPCPSTPVTPDVPSEYGALINDFDATRLAALFPASKPPKTAVHEQNFAEMRRQLGTCGAPEYMWSRAGMTRWTYPCERGNLEASYALDADGKITSVRTYAAGVPASESMENAARSVLASLPLAADATRPYRHNLRSAQVQALGRCELLRPWAVSPHLSLFHARCEKGQDIVLGVRMRAGKIVHAKILPASTLHKGVPM